MHIDPWSSLKEFTSARIALGRTGNSLPLKEMLQFKLAHAHARDAVFASLDATALQQSLQSLHVPVFTLHSRVANRFDYLKHPDRGRRLDEQSVQQLTTGNTTADIAITVADGLSANAINKGVNHVLSLFVPALKLMGFKQPVICLVSQSRVAVGDEVGFLLKASVSVVIIGERPGLSSPESMGVYITYAPALNLTDEARNCVSNICRGGLTYRQGVDKIIYLISEMTRLKLSGVQLKDNNNIFPDRQINEGCSEK